MPWAQARAAATSARLPGCRDLGDKSDSASEQLTGLANIRETLYISREGRFWTDVRAYRMTGHPGVAEGTFDKGDISMSTTARVVGSGLPRSDPSTPDGPPNRATTGSRDREIDADEVLGAARVSVIIPALNEAANLPHVMPLIPEGVHEVLLVDGHSSDDTIEVARRLRPDVRVILQDRRGKGNALACGFAAATGEIIVMLDADGSTDPREIPVYVRPLTEGADFVKGSRWMQGGGSTDISAVRGLGNRALTGLVNLLHGSSYTDLCYGYNAFWSHCLPHMHVDCDGFEVETQINIRIIRAGLDVREVPSHESERLNGKSNLHTVRDGRRVLKMILSEWLRPASDPDPGWTAPFEEVRSTFDDVVSQLA
jgi:Glycosyl transferase family 2